MLKDLKIRNKILLGIGSSFIIGMLIVSALIYFQFNSLADSDHQSLKKSLLDKEREKIKQLVQTRAQSLGQVYRENKEKLSAPELKKLIADRNEDIKFGNDNYFYVYSLEGNTISLPPDRAKEGTNRWDLKVNGNYLLREMAELAKSDGGFFTYDYQNPNTGEVETKFGYIKSIPGTDWFVGAGGYESVINSLLEQKRAEINSYKYKTLVSMAIAFALITVAIIVIIVIISRYLTGNINKLLAGMHQLAKGDLDIDLKAESQDELGELITTFNQAVANQRKTIVDIVEAVDDISAYSEELSASSEEADNALEKATENIKQLSSTTRQVATSSEEVAQLSQEANNQTASGSEVVNEVVDKMKVTDQLVIETEEIINSLDNTSQEIGVLIEMITDIAEETNLLALNASIEAARATSNNKGAGQGFAVVAEEIKELAGKTSQTADKAISLIEEINSRSNQGLEAIEEVAEHTSEGRELVEKTGDLFADIAETIEDTSAYMEETTASAEELAATSEQVEESTKDIKAMSKDVAKSAEELAQLANNLKSLKEEYTL